MSNNTRVIPSQKTEDNQRDNQRNIRSVELEAEIFEIKYLKQCHYKIKMKLKKMISSDVK